MTDRQMQELRELLIEMRIENKGFHAQHSRRLDFLEKVVFGTISLFLITLLSIGIYRVFNDAKPRPLAGNIILHRPAPTIEGLLKT